MCGPEVRACSTVPVAVGKLTGVKALAGGEEHGFALLDNGTVMAWGAGGSGQLGDGTKTNSDVPVGVCEVHYSGPGPCPPEHYLKGVTAIAASGGPGGGVALLEDGTVVDWGVLSFSALGDGATKESDVPVGVCEVGYSGATPCSAGHYLKEVKAIAAGSRFALALFGSGGEVAAWGESPLNSGSVFGAGTTKQSYEVPVAVCAVNEKAPCARNLSAVTALAVGEDQGLALSGGKVVDWGEGTSGALGDGKTEGANAPVEVQGISEEATAIAGGHTFSLALLKGGKVAAWGTDGEGQLGDSTAPEECGEIPLNAPCSKKAIAGASGLSGVTAIAAGKNNGLALLANGAVYDWGPNGLGQLGDGTSTGPEPCKGFEGFCSKTPVEVSKLVDAKGIAGGERFGLALVPLPPVVTAISPEQGPKTGGTTVTITGAEFEEATAVRFGSNFATSVKVSEDGTKITAVSPAGAGTADVTVTTPVGTSLTSPADKFYYERPTIKKLSPKKGPELGGTSVTITGTNFAGVTAVRFGSTEATSFKVNSQTSITAVSPAHTRGKVDVTVATTNGTSPISNKDRFKYT
jgi:alpha-tubulin suppressor-like RCC1 family protein